MTWNLRNSQTSINGVGCIHTCEGLEFDYAGVIMDDNIRYEDSKIVTDYTKEQKRINH